MKLNYDKKSKDPTYFIQKGFRNGSKTTTKNVARIGKHSELLMITDDPLSYAREQVARYNREEKNGRVSMEVKIDFNEKIKITNVPASSCTSLNIGYLFLQQLYHRLGISPFFKEITSASRITFDPDLVNRFLTYDRILYPGSKLNSLKHLNRYYEQPSFDYQHIHRTLDIMAGCYDEYISHLYETSCSIVRRNTSVCYYDCTNFYFEIEQAEDDKQYGVSKENRPLPIVEMGLFMDAEGIPLAFCINPGNQNEQLSLIPLEEKLLANFDMSRFVVCTDAGLSSTGNRKFNADKDGNRAYVTTQSIKKLKKHLKEWTLDVTGWKLSGDPEDKCYDISSIDEAEHKDSIFYKSRWMKEDGLEQQLIVTYSVKYRDYQRTIRNRQIERALKTLKNGKASVESKRQNDPKRFIKADHATKEGEAADRTMYYIDETIVKEEEIYDGFYAVCTNLEDDAQAIVKINKRRWEIEECFRIMKSEFDARPVYLQDSERIKAHFMTCFIALIVYRYLEKKLDEKYTCSQLIDCLREMNYLRFEGKGYIPTYTKTKLTDDLHAAFGFDTATEIIPIMKMKKICAQTKKR